MFRLNTLVWCYRFLFFCILTCCCTLPLPGHLHGNPLPDQLLLPFSFFMLNSNHYFQRKASPKLLYQVFVLGGGKPPSNTHSGCCSSSSQHFWSAHREHFLLEKNVSSSLKKYNIWKKKVRLTSSCGDLIIDCFLCVIKIHLLIGVFSSKVVKH